VCKLKDVELLEPLVPSVKNNLDHRHTYVRRNAVLAIFSLYRSFDYLLPDAPEIIFNFLQKVSDGVVVCVVVCVVFPHTGAGGRGRVRYVLLGVRVSS
jgi:vesicle coat complex subunit